MTTKGELVRSILFPPPLDFKFHRDFIKSIGVFLSMGLVGMSYSLYMWHRNGVSNFLYDLKNQVILNVFGKKSENYHKFLYFNFSRELCKRCCSIRWIS